MHYFYKLILILLLQTATYATSIQNTYTFEELNKLNASDVGADDQFGFSVAISGDYAIVGAYKDNGNGLDSGSVYIFKNDGNGNFTQSAKLLASDRDLGDNFGYSVAISGDYAIVGAWKNNDKGANSGSAYIFKNDGNGNFTQTSKLLASDGSANDIFGESVAISGNYAIVGARGDDDKGSASGSVYIFKNDGNGNFTQTIKLRPSDGAAGDRFGTSVAITDDYAIVGARLDDDKGTNSGSAYVFKDNGLGYFSPIGKLLASDGAASDFFGYSVAMTDDYAIIGAWGDDDKGAASGSAYIFKHNGQGVFTQTGKLLASDGVADDYFGHSVAISGDYAIVGAWRNNTGSAYVFKNDGIGNFTQSTKLLASDGSADDYFGHSVAISGNNIFVSASMDDDNGVDTGSVYIFNPVINADTPENSSTFSLDIDATDANDYSLFGTDSALFNINAATGEITFKDVADYEQPADEDQNNIYELIVSANGNESSDVKSVHINVTDMTAPTIENAYSVEELNKLNASDASNGDYFGISVSIWGDYAIVGAYADTENGPLSGSAYIFKKDSNGDFIQSAKLLPSDATAGAFFGWNVSLRGDYAIVGAYLDAENGSAYIFKKDSNGDFIQSAKLTASDGVANDHFGYSVSLSDDYAIIGANGDDDNGDSSGSAYIFKNDGNGNFTQSAKLLASDGAEDDSFANGVAMTNDYAIVGAYRDDDKGTASGSAYIFKNDGTGNFTQSAKLTASDGKANDYFAKNVAISGDYVIVGATALRNGSAYIFKNDGTGNFTQSAKLRASDGAHNDSFGKSVAISGDYAIVGADNNDDNGSSSGSAYIFKNDGTGNFTQSAKLLPSDGKENNHFGRSVSIYGGNIFVGAIGDSGSAYNFMGVIKANTLEQSSTFLLDIDAIETLNYSISGTDSALFSIDPQNGEIVFKIAPYYTFPADANGDNVYELRVTANGDSDTDTIAIKITVTTNTIPVIQNAYSLDELNKLSASDGAGDDFFGYSVSISGNYAIVGAYGDDDNGSKSGAAYIFEKDSNGDFIQSMKLRALDAAKNGYFGLSVGISGDYAIVGAQGNTDNGSYAGAAYIFKNDGTGNFTQSAKLLASDGAGSAYFGYSVAISGQYAIVGAWGNEAAYIFKNDGNGNFTQSAKLLDADGVAGDSFGISVAISGDYAIVGDYRDDDNGPDAGSAYIFTNDGTGNFTQSSKLLASDGAGTDYFGRAVAIYGNYAIVGAYGDDDNGADSGSAYIFINDGTGNFIQSAKLLASDGAAGDAFGFSVTLSDTDAIVGAPWDNYNRGSVYRFKNDGTGNFTQSEKINASDVGGGDYFGQSVALLGEYAMVGAHKDNNKGSAYVFSTVIHADTEENNSTFILDINATDTIAYSISGTDSALFNINSTSGEIGFKVLPDYENPLDANGDNVYELQVTADEGSSTMTRAIKITVNDLDEIAPSGYTISIDGAEITQNSLSFTISSAEIGTTYTYTLSSSRGGTLTFSDTITSNPQTITIPDLSGLMDGTVTLSVTLTDSAGNTGTQEVALSVLNIVVEGISITMIDSNTSESDTNNTATFNVKLLSAPVYYVDIALTSTDTSEGVVNAPIGLSFTEADWDTAQLVTVTGVDDNELDGDTFYNIELNATSADAEYDTKSTSTTLLNEDDENNAMNPAVILYLLN